jgi:hypothetical protein
MDRKLVDSVTETFFDKAAGLLPMATYLTMACHNRAVSNPCDLLTAPGETLTSP